MSILDEAEKLRRRLSEEEEVTVSVALFGQPGAGKSSLINKIVGRPVADVGVETDKTVAAATYEWNGLKLIDLPGYGTTRFPKDGYFEQFQIAELDLLLCVSSGKLHQADTDFFHDLAKRGKVCIFVVNKCDELWEEGVDLAKLKERKHDDIIKHVQKEVNVLFTSCRTNEGLDALQNAIDANLFGAKRERWQRSAKAYSSSFLQEKHDACVTSVIFAAGVSAANGLNPIPGADIAVDVGTLLKLFKELRNDYGLNDKRLASLKTSAIPLIASVANDLVEYATKNGIVALLKKYASREAVKGLSKYVPLVGQAIAASLGFGITYSVGMNYLEDCHKLAKAILEGHLEV